MKFECPECRHNFNVSLLRLLFTRRFSGRNPPTGVVAYYLKCPWCGKKSWIVPLPDK